ncbi:metalloendopeptidase [Metarhizium acridum CQMa 102]|uniref:deuterolysin n=1 Tax=Metarhizium acridum (strain CQMa 102) TaxID=655827 RepID=E9E2C2_METAQ|nr:metalloendopeptidase [Metarhizium acridum CQMa 102]EFY90038.1 metalloendopeptidase [Metarhizium acridum CQMa 102]
MRLLAIIAPLTLAAAHPAVPEDWPKSLNVRAELDTWTKLNITIENKSPKAFNILKAGSVLDGNPLESMRVFLERSCRVGITNSFDRPRTDPKNESEFQFMPVGGSITTTIDLLDVRNASGFCGNKNTLFWIDATFRTAEAGSTKLVRSIRYKLDNALIYPKFFPPLPEAFEERVYKCPPDYLSVLKEGILGCASLATAARKAALTGSAELMEGYFKDSSQETRNSVANTFDKVATLCSLNNTRLYITCSPNRCRRPVFASIFRDSDPANLMFCKRGYFQPMFPDFDEISSIIHTVIHEFTHSKWIKDTQDIAYGLHKATNLRKDESIMNADTYALFSDAVYLNEDRLNKTRVDDFRARIKKIQPNLDKLGDITRSEFLSLPPKVRQERFGFEV